MTIYRQFRVTYRKRLLVYSLLCVALATGNALFWLHKWHEQGVELCFADTMMTGVQPSFLLMLLIPPTLGLVHQLKFILEQPFVICALDNRARLARNLLAALLFIAFRAVMAVSIPSIALGALLFRGGKPCTWESGASYYAYMTGQTFLSNANVKGQKAVTENISQADSMNLTQPSDESSDAAQMKIISSANGIIASSILGNEKGCYEVFDRPAGGGNLLYTDYATKSHIYLSNQINSDHNNESDTSYLESTIGGCYLALSDDYLFIFKLNTPSFAADETSERQGYIARCDLDGADRQILTKLAANESIVSGCVACDGENLYYLSCLLQDDGTTTPSTLIQLKIADGTRREICQLDSESRHFIVGAHQDKIILKSILNPARLSDDLSAEDIVRAVQEQVHQLTLLSSDGQQQELCRWKQDERSEMFMNGNMYYWDKETNGLYCWDLESDTPECLFAGPIRFDDEVSYDQLSLSADSFDGHLLATAVQDSDGQAVSCAFDPISKSLQKLTLTSDDEKSVLILAEGSEYFLVRYGLMEYEVPDYAPDGREITTTMLLPNLRLIAKSDYWNNISNYILLDDYVYSRKS